MSDTRAFAGCIAAAQVMRAVMLDPRYTALPKMGEKKQFWNAWKAKRAKEEREEARQQLVAAREALLELLTSSEEVVPGSRFRDIERRFRDDPIFQAVPDRDRADVFEDALARRTQLLKEAQLAREARLQEQLVTLFGQLPAFDFATTWEEAEAAVRQLPNFGEGEVAGAERLAVLQAWEVCSRAAMDTQLERMSGLRDEQRHADRLARDAFVALLEEMERGGQLHAQCTWRELYPTVSNDRRYTDLLGAEGSTALDLFKLRVETLADALHSQKKTVAAALASSSLAFDHTTTVEVFLGALAEAGGAVEDVAPLNLKFIFEALHERAEEREADRVRHERRAAEKRAEAFRRMLYKARKTLVTQRSLSVALLYHPMSDPNTDLLCPPPLINTNHPWLQTGKRLHVGGIPGGFCRQ